MHSNQHRLLKESMDPEFQLEFDFWRWLNPPASGGIAAHKNKGHGVWALLQPPLCHPAPNLDDIKKKNMRHNVSGSIFCESLLNSCQAGSADVAQGFKEESTRGASHQNEWEEHILPWDNKDTQFPISASRQGQGKTTDSFDHPFQHLPKQIHVFVHKKYAASWKATKMPRQTSVLRQAVAVPQAGGGKHLSSETKLSLSQNM